MDNSFPLESPSMSRRQLLNFLTGAVVASLPLLHFIQ